MAYNAIGGFPQQQLSFSKKNKAWRKKCVDFADDHSLMHCHLTRKSVKAMKINYDLLNGKLHMDDLKAFINPYDIEASFIPDNIQHYPVINSKLNVLIGEESERLFDFRVVVTNPNAISEMEEEKNAEANARLQQLIADSSQSEDQFNEELEKLADYFTYEYQDKREVRGNLFLNHYMKEYDIPQLFNSGFIDALVVGEEIYQCDIVGGEPVIEKIDPMKIRIIRSGYNHEIESADVIILEDYWNPGKVIDTFWDQLSKKDIEKIENGDDSGNSPFTDSMDNIDPRYGFYLNPDYPWNAGDAVVNPDDLFNDDINTSLTPYDLNGNVRVLRVYWKSRRKIKKVKSYDPETGEEQFNFYPETYIIDPMKGEEEQVFWVNEAWEGTKIGNDIYVNMRPRPVQYNRLSNPSRCHFGIIGSIYSINGYEPFSMVDTMKPYAYLYDVVSDRLNKLLARNKGKITRMDFAKVPNGWDVDKWLYYINVNGIAVEDSFKEGNKGASLGKMAGGLNNASSGVIDASEGNEIQFHINLLEWIKNNIGEMPGISKQREGQISNRETVGGVERATLQSSHITKRWFFIHDNVKKRVLECFLETAKIAYKGRKIKFDYILSDGSKQLFRMDGDEFSECDFGIVVENSNELQQLNQSLGALAQAGIQNDKMNFSTLMKIYTTKSTAERMKYIENYEKRALQLQQQQQQQQMQMQQQQMQMQAQIEQAKMQQEYMMHQEKLENNILVAQINGEAENIRMALMNHDNAEANTLEREKIAENARQFDAKLKEDAKQFESKLSLDKRKQQDDARIKEKQIAAKKSS